jgi:glycosyltransferase involved in cell wall biosynthesis
VALGPCTLPAYGYTSRLGSYLQQQAQHWDAVIIEGLWQYHGYATWLALHQSHTPYFVFPHGMLDPWFNRAYRLKHLKKQLYWQSCEYWVLQDAKALFFTSPEEQERAQQSFCPWPDTPGEWVPLGLQAPCAASIAAQKTRFLQEYPELAGKRILLYLGRLHPKKGLDLLLQAWAKLVQRQAGTSGSSQPIHLVIVGPPYEDGYGMYLKVRAHGLLKDQHHTLSWIDMLGPSLKWGCFAAADMFILPSHQENFGLVLAESMATGTPVLTTYAVNTWAMVTSNHAGYAAPDTQAGIDTLLEAWWSTTTTQRKCMSQNAQHCFEQSLTIQATTPVLEKTLLRYLS